MLVTPVKWTQPDRTLGQRHLVLRASLRDDVGTLEGVSLQVACSPEGVQLPIYVVLLAEYRGRPKAIARIDVNGQRHENLNAICGDLQHMDAGPTHFHDPALHTEIDLHSLLGGAHGDLPIARALTDLPDDFPKLMAKCGELLHIGNLTAIEEPQWQPRHFPF